MNGFDKVVGYEDLKKEMKIICDSMKNPEKYAKLGATIPRGILLYGEPGIGKSLLAKVFSEETGRIVFTLRKDRPDGEFVKYIKETFNKARENAPSVVLLDDMDKFSNGDIKHRDSEEYVTVQACIDDVKESDIFVIATVNERRVLPDSLTRAGRFDKVIEMRCPEGEDTVKIVDYYLRQKQIVEDVDAREIARILDGKSCADLECIVNEAGLYAAYDNRTKIAHNDLIRACLRYIYNAPEKGIFENDEYKRNVAVHEAGHALVSEVLNPGSVNLISIAGYAGDVAGVTSVSMPNGYWNSLEMMQHRVIYLLAGKAASEVVSGIVDVGARSDISRAFNIVKRFVDDYCSFDFSCFEYDDAGLIPNENRDKRVAIEVDKYYQMAIKIIRSNKDLLDNLVEKLMEKQTITGRDIRDESFVTRSVLLNP